MRFVLFLGRCGRQQLGCRWATLFRVYASLQLMFSNYVYIAEIAFSSRHPSSCLEETVCLKQLKGQQCVDPVAFHNTTPIPDCFS